MLKSLTPKQQESIVKNVVAAVNNIENLNKTGYSFINLSNGFIAHHNLYGFIGHYQEHDLKSDILYNHDRNQWSNFRPGEQNYEYYMTKKEIYNRIVAEIK
jgi:hypothetical protein